MVQKTGVKPFYHRHYHVFFVLMSWLYLGCIPSEHHTGGGEDWRDDRIIYTKHALCRMKCRQIDEREVKEILASGRINDAKSEPAGKPDPKFALEGGTSDKQ